MVYVMCVNDGAVMTAWKKDQGLAGSEKIEFVADTSATLTTALGLMLTGTPATNPNLAGTPYENGAGTPPLVAGGPNNVLGAHTKRCKRSAMYVVDGVVKAMAISEAPDDPAGDDRPQSSVMPPRADTRPSRIGIGHAPASGIRHTTIVLSS